MGSPPLKSSGAWAHFAAILGMQCVMHTDPCASTSTNSRRHARRGPSRADARPRRHGRARGARRAARSKFTRSYTRGAASARLAVVCRARSEHWRCAHAPFAQLAACLSRGVARAGRSAASARQGTSRREAGGAIDIIYSTLHARRAASARAVVICRARSEHWRRAHAPFAQLAACLMRGVARAGRSAASAPRATWREVG